MPKIGKLKLSNVLELVCMVSAWALFHCIIFNIYNVIFIYTNNFHCNDLVYICSAVLVWVALALSSLLMQ